MTAELVELRQAVADANHGIAVADPVAVQDRARHRLAVSA